MKYSLSSLFGQRHRSTTIHIVGGGITGLMAAIDLADESRRQALNLTIVLYESEAFGGGASDQAASPRSHLRLHTDGQLYASHQPDVSLSLQKSTRRLQQLAPTLFEGLYDDPPRGPLALVFEPIDYLDPPVSEFYTALGVWFRPVPTGVVSHWYPMFPMQRVRQVYRVRDSTIDLGALSHLLMLEALRRGVKLVRQRVASLDVLSDRVGSLHLNSGERVQLSKSDQVVLACGAALRPLLTGVGIRVPGLRLFQCETIATSAFALPVIAIVYSAKGVNCTPHKRFDGTLLNVFGNTARTELPPEMDGKPLQIDGSAVKTLCHDVEEWFGLDIPTNHRRVWSAVKMEVVTEEIGSQAYHVSLVPGLANAWLAIPGKLSQAAACSQDLAIRLCQALYQESGLPVAQPIWNRLS